MMKQWLFADVIAGRHWAGMPNLRALNPEMERVLVEGTVKEACAGTIGIFEASHRRDRVPEAKTLGMEGFHGLSRQKDTQYFSGLPRSRRSLAMTVFVD